MAASAKNNLLESFRCPICYNFLRHAVQIPGESSCGHTFCRECLAHHVDSGAMACNKCPVCRTVIDLRKPFVSVPFIDRQLRDVRVPCILRCGWEGPMKFLESHNCPKLLVTCGNDGCNVQTEAGDMSTHLAECKHALDRCPLCVQEMSRAKLHSNHYGVDCPMETISCRFCGTGFTRQDMEHHESNVCPERKVECALGCGHTFTAKEEYKHNENSLSSHVSMLASFQVIGNFRVRQWINVHDVNHGWYFGEILAFDPFRHCALVTFAGFESHYDEWIEIGPERMRLFDESDPRIKNKHQVYQIPLNAYIGNGRTMTTSVRNRIIDSLPSELRQPQRQVGRTLLNIISDVV